ncbi:IS1 family transposase [Photorhabdus temperata]
MYNVASKFYTQRIERGILNLISHLNRLNRKTLRNVKFPEMHDKLLAHFIKREHYLYRCFAC